MSDKDDQLDHRYHTAQAYRDRLQKAQEEIEILREALRRQYECAKRGESKRATTDDEWCNHFAARALLGHDIPNAAGRAAAKRGLASIRAAVEARRRAQPGGLKAIFGKWPGDETDEAVEEALKSQRERAELRKERDDWQSRAEEAMKQRDEITGKVYGFASTIGRVRDYAAGIEKDGGRFVTAQAVATDLQRILDDKP